ncbi:MAG: histidine kinase [Eubacteriales bacterium]|nr:histidine kinase [Eubacteriales bacterium]
MQSLADRCILLFYCLSSLMFVPPDARVVTAFFLALIFSSLLYLSANCFLRFFLTLIYGTALFFLPALVLFLPLALYSFCLPYRHEEPAWNYIPLFAAAAGLLFFAREGSFRIFIYAAMGCLLCVYLQYHTQRYEKLSFAFRQTRDDGTEAWLLLKEKNRALLEKQDYEIYAATLRERNRIAREIHDNVGHMLTRSILMTGALKTINKDESLKRPLGQLEDTLNSAMNSIRESVHDLHDRSVNLEENLRILIDDFMFCSAVLTYDMSGDVPAQVKYCFIAVTKEALVNVSRHSNASKVTVCAQEHPAFYRLSIQDNGTVRKSDFPASSPEISAGGGKTAPPEVSRGIGLSNMMTRVHALNGTFQVLTDRGFCIFITIPKQE